MALTQTSIPRQAHGRFIEQRSCINAACIHGGFPVAIWSGPAVHTASNCSAHHQGAGRGSFDADEVRVPV